MANPLRVSLYVHYLYSIPFNIIFTIQFLNQILQPAFLKSLVLTTCSISGHLWTASMAAGRSLTPKINHSSVHEPPRQFKLCFQALSVPFTCLGDCATIKGALHSGPAGLDGVEVRRLGWMWNDPRIGQECSSVGVLRRVILLQNQLSRTNLLGKAPQQRHHLQSGVTITCHFFVIGNLFVII
jgi:hypothetical protein